MPSLDRSSLLQPRTNYWNIKTVVHKLAIGRHIRLMSCKKTCLFMELKAFSTSKTASVSFVANMSCFECTAASHYASFPLYNCISKDGYYSGTWFRWYKYVWWNQRWPSGDRICNCQIISMLIFFLRSLVCNPDLQDPPLVFIVAFLTNSLLYHQKRRVNYMWFFIDKCFFASWLWLRMLLL